MAKRPRKASPRGFTVNGQHSKSNAQGMLKAEALKTWDESHFYYSIFAFLAVKRPASAAQLLRGDRKLPKRLFSRLQRLLQVPDLRQNTIPRLM